MAKQEFENTYRFDVFKRKVGLTLKLGQKTEY